MIRKVDRLSCTRFGSARYSVPVVHIGRQVEVRVADGCVQVIFLGEIVAEHLVVALGEASVSDDHYGGPRGAPARAVRPKTAAEKGFCALGPVAEAFIKGAAARRKVPGGSATGPTRTLPSPSTSTAVPSGRCNHTPSGSTAGITSEASPSGPTERNRPSHGHQRGPHSSGGRRP